MGPFWSKMGVRRRRSMSSLKKEDIPLDAGVYALYRSGKRAYVGKAKCLQNRVWKNHSGRGLGMGSSAMRRNVAEHLGIAPAKDIKEGLYRMSAEEAKRVRTWLDRCEIAWRKCATEAAAVKLEKAMKREYSPPLTKR
jgi:hypothetical protein